MLIIHSAKYNRTERLLHLFDGSGLLHNLFCVICFAILSRRNYPTRLETRTKEFNWIASRRVHFSQCSHGEAKANSYDVKLTILLQYKLITHKHRALSVCLTFYVLREKY